MKPMGKKAPSFIAGRVINESRANMEKWVRLARRHILEKSVKYKGAVTVTIKAVFKRPLDHYKRQIRGGDERLRKTAARFHV